jgi:hypothetical protein
MLLGRGLLRELPDSEVERPGDDVRAYEAEVGVCRTDNDGRGMRDGVPETVVGVWWEVDRVRGAEA